jgi:uncharacterized protein
MEVKVFFQTTDGLKLCGILLTPKQKTQTCIILCHGITVDKEEDGIFTNLAKKLCDAGFAVFRFDFRGHGESEGRSVDMTITGELEDLKAAVYFLQGKKYKTFGILGASFASGAVSFFSSKYQKLIKALILWNAVIDYSENINPTLSWTKKYWGQAAFERIKKFGFTTVGSRKFEIGEKLIKEIKILKPWKELLKLSIPILFIHGDKDNYVPVDDSIKYFKMMKNAKLEIIHGADHGFHENQKFAEQGEKATIDFLKRYL